MAVSTSAPQCRAGAAVQGAGLACPRLSQVLSQTGEAAEEENRHTDRQRGGCRACLSLKESQDVKCAGAVSAAVFRGESTR